MTKYDDGLCSYEECNRLRISISDAVEEWIAYCGSDPEVGIAIEPRTLRVELCGRQDSNGREWYPLEQFARDGESDDEAVNAFADSICFVG